MNGVEVREQPQAGDRVKIVVEGAFGVSVRVQSRGATSSVTAGCRRQLEHHEYVIAEMYAISAMHCR